MPKGHKTNPHKKGVQGELFGIRHPTIKPTTLELRERELHRLRLVPHLDMRTIEPTYNLLEKVYNFMMERNKIPKRISEIDREVAHLRNLIRNNPQDPENYELKAEIEKLINHRDLLKYKSENPNLPENEKIILTLLNRMFNIPNLRNFFTNELRLFEEGKRETPERSEYQFPFSVGKAIDLALYYIRHDYSASPKTKRDILEIINEFRKLKLEFQLAYR